LPLHHTSLRATCSLSRPAADLSPDIVERIDAFLDAAAEEGANKGKGKERVLGINQVLVNEYHRGQGISVSLPLEGGRG
jgi:hypothetical protein